GSLTAVKVLSELVANRDNHIPTLAFRHALLRAQNDIVPAEMGDIFERYGNGACEIVGITRASKFPPVYRTDSLLTPARIRLNKQLLEKRSQPSRNFYGQTKKSKASSQKPIRFKWLYLPLAALYGKSRLHRERYQSLQCSRRSPPSGELRNFEDDERNYSQMDVLRFPLVSFKFSRKLVSFIVQPERPTCHQNKRDIEFIAAALIRGSLSARIAFKLMIFDQLQMRTLTQLWAAQFLMKSSKKEQPEKRASFGLRKRCKSALVKLLKCFWL
ncbi:hypothetical protein M514_17007, partial [Trichuris suis]